MQPQSSKEITRLLVAWTDGDDAALNQLAPLIHAELHRLAHQYMSRERPGHLLQTSALINEVARHSTRICVLRDLYRQRDSRDS